MTLQSSGPIKASEIRAEFSGSGPFSLSDYYAGGANVPAGAEGDGGPIPTSGIIKFSDFYGASDLIEGNKTLTVGVFADTRGYVNGGFGALSPNSLFRTVQIESISARVGLLDGEMDGISLPQDFWRTIIIQGALTLQSADATFSTVGGTKTQWRFTTAFAFPNSSYDLVFRHFP